MVKGEIINSSAAAPPKEFSAVLSRSERILAATNSEQKPARRIDFVKPHTAAIKSTVANITIALKYLL